MKFFVSVIILLLALSGVGKAQDGYTVTIQLQNATPGMLRLSVYRGSPAFAVVMDSVRISKPDEVVKFIVSKKILGGIYKLELNGDKQNSRNIVLDNGKKLTASFSSNQLTAITTTDSLNNLFLKLQGPGLTKPDREKYLKEFLAKYPLSVAALYARLELKKIEAAGYTGTLERLKIIDNYFKDIVLDDKRIPLLPNIYSYLFEYIRLTPVSNDSYKKNVNRMLKGMNCHTRNYFFYLDWVFKNIKYYEKINLNETFKYVYDKYLNTSECLTVNKDFHSKITQEVVALSDLRPGTHMPDIAIQDSLGKPYSLKELYSRSQYTLLVLYDPACDHCKEIMPKMSAFFGQKNYPENYLKLIAFRNTPSRVGWQKFIDSCKLHKWLNAEPNKNDKKYADTLKAYTNPMFFLMDQQGNIIQRKYDDELYSRLLKQP